MQEYLFRGKTAILCPLDPKARETSSTTSAPTFTHIPTHSLRLYVSKVFSTEAMGLKRLAELEFNAGKDQLA